MLVFVLQGARGNDGAAGAAGPPVSLLFSKKKIIIIMICSLVVGVKV